MLRGPGDPAGREWGLTENLQSVRRYFVQNLATPLTEAIPSNRKFGQVLPCALEHPGFCRCHWTDSKSDAHAALAKCLQDWSVGDLVGLRFTHEDGHSEVHYKFIASLKDPKRIVFLRASVVDGEVGLSRSQGEQLDFEMTATALHLVWLACGSLPSMVTVERYWDSQVQPSTLAEAVQPWCGPCRL